MFGFGRRQPPPLDPRILVQQQRPDLVYAIGDIHGCHQQLLALESQIAEEIASSGQTALVVYLGDLIDRGPDSFAVMSHLQSRRPPFARLILSGNHEEMFLDFLAAPSPRHVWLKHGGIETLRSYDLDADALFDNGRAAAIQKLDRYIPPEHVAFLEKLPICLALPGLTLVHAGLAENLPIERQPPGEMMWRRLPVPAYSEPQPFGLLVHGHTPSKTPLIEPYRICIDTGAFATGILSAVAIDRENRPRILNSHGCLS